MEIKANRWDYYGVLRDVDNNIVLNPNKPFDADGWVTFTIGGIMQWVNDKDALIIGHVFDSSGEYKNGERISDEFRGLHQAYGDDVYSSHPREFIDCFYIFANNEKYEVYIKGKYGERIVPFQGLDIVQKGDVYGYRLTGGKDGNAG